MRPFTTCQDNVFKRHNVALSSKTGEKYSKNNTNSPIQKEKYRITPEQCTSDSPYASFSFRFAAEDKFPESLKMWNTKPKPPAHSARATWPLSGSHQTVMDWAQPIQTAATSGPD
jgi:hypothetical protein